MADKDETIAVATVQKMHPKAVDVHASKTVPLRSGLDGKLIYVSYTLRNAAGNPYESKAVVYFPLSGDPTSFDKPDDFIQWYGTQNRGTLVKILDPEKIGGVAGVIALVIACSICWKYIHTPVGGTTEIPAVLSTALSAIIGFYFGSKTKDVVKELGKKL